MVASCSDNVGGRDLLQWVCSIVRENRHDSNMLGIFGDLPDSQAASEVPRIGGLSRYIHRVPSLRLACGDLGDPFLWGHCRNRKVLTD